MSPIVSPEVIYMLKIACVLSWLVVLSTFILKKILSKKMKDVVEEEHVEEEQKIIQKSPLHKLGQVMHILFYVYVGCTIVGYPISWYLEKVPEINWKVDLLVIFGIFIPGIIFFNIGEDIVGLARKAKTLEEEGNGT